MTAAAKTPVPAHKQYTRFPKSPFPISFREDVIPMGYAARTIPSCFAETEIL